MLLDLKGDELRAIEQALDVAIRDLRKRRCWFKRIGFLVAISESIKVYESALAVVRLAWHGYKAKEQSTTKGDVS